MNLSIICLIAICQEKYYVHLQYLSCDFVIFVV